MEGTNTEAREKTIEERLEALDWCIENIEMIRDRLVRAYVLKLKRLIEEEEQSHQLREEGVETPPSFLSEAKIIDKTSFQEVLVVE
jgi:hypothetical protein